MRNVTAWNNENFARSLEIILPGYALPLAGKFLLQGRRTVSDTGAPAFEFSTDKGNAVVTAYDTNKSSVVLALLEYQSLVASLSGHYFADLVYYEGAESVVAESFIFEFQQGVSRPTLAAPPAYSAVASWGPITDLAGETQATVVQLLQRGLTGPQGPAGATGPAGADGQPGPTGPAGSYTIGAGLSLNGSTLSLGDGAGTVRLGGSDGAAPVAQTIQAQSASGVANAAGAALTMKGSAGTGNASGGAIVWRVAPAGASGSSQNAYVPALWLTASREMRQYISGDETNGSYFAVAPSGSNIEIKLDRVGAGQYGNITFVVGGGLALGIVNSAGRSARMPSSGDFSWSNTGNPTDTADLVLARDAAGILAQRNGANAQTARFYRAYTDAANYQRITLGWNVSTALLMNEGAGTGADGSVAFNDAVLATNATKGFVMIPSCAGAPTGTPADIPAGQIPMVFDSTNFKLYVYTGGAWKSSAAFV